MIQEGVFDHRPFLFEKCYLGWIADCTILVPRCCQFLVCSVYFNACVTRFMCLLTLFREIGVIWILCLDAPTRNRHFMTHWLMWTTDPAHSFWKRKVRWLSGSPVKNFSEDAYQRWHDQLHVGGGSLSHTRSRPTVVVVEVEVRAY